MLQRISKQHSSRKQMSDRCPSSWLLPQFSFAWHWLAQIWANERQINENRWSIMQSDRHLYYYACFSFGRFCMIAETTEKYPHEIFEGLHCKLSEHHRRTVKRPTVMECICLVPAVPKEAATCICGCATWTSPEKKTYTWVYGRNKESASHSQVRNEQDLVAGTSFIWDREAKNDDALACIDQVDQYITTGEPKFP
jgi:hypothetical protein